MKKKLLKMLMGTALVMGLAACGGGDDEGGGDTAKSDAEEIFAQNCASCHGGDLKGGMGPDLSAIGASKSKDEIADIIKNGQGGMPKGLIEGEELDKVADWLAAKK